MLAAQLQNEDQACTIISVANQLVCRRLVLNFAPHSFRVADSCYANLLLEDRRCLIAWFV